MGTLCDNGCGSPAKYVSLNGSLLCESNKNKCEMNRLATASRVKKDWSGNKGDIRKRNANFSEIAKLASPRQPTIICPSTAKEYRRYARAARTRAQRWARDNGYEIGQQTFHVDHRVSLLECFLNGVDISTANHPCNLRVIDAKDNVAKGSRSSMTLNELNKLIENYDE